MAEQDRIEQLDAAIDAVLRGRAPEAAGAEVAGMLEIASALREVADPHFRASLKWKIVPRTRHTMVPHFTVHGAAALIEFLEEAFGAHEEFRAPMPDGSIAHAVVVIGDSVVEMGDAPKDMKPTRLALHVYVDDVDVTYENAIAAGATAVRAPADQFYGDRDATIIDPHDNTWHIATHLAPGQPVRPGLRRVTPFFHPRAVDRMMAFLGAAFDAQVEHEPYKSPEGFILHAAMRIGDSVIELGAGPGEWKSTEGGIHLYVDDCDAVYARAIAAGATTVYAPYNAPYGERTAFIVDPFGNNWYIGTPIR